MKNCVGFISNCLQGTLEEKMKVANQLGYTTLEVACWPKGSQKQCDINPEELTKSEIEKIKLLEDFYKVKISTLVYYENMLIDDVSVRAKYLMHLLYVIDAAWMLKIPYVGTYVGKNFKQSIEENFVSMVQVFKPILTYAKEKNVTILIENCPMPTWSPEGNPSTITYSPELLERTFALLPQDNFGLNYDPSHLYWQGIDYLQVLEDFASHIKSVHIKDVTLNSVNRQRYGLYGKYLDKKHPYDYGYYQDTLVGYGDIKWLELFQKMKTLKLSVPVQVEYKNSNGYGVIADPVRGLALSRQYLSEVM